MNQCGYICVEQIGGGGEYLTLPFIMVEKEGIVIL